VAARESSKTKASTSTADDPRRDPYEPSEDEKTAVKHWQARVTRAEKDNEDFFNDLSKLRAYVAGTKHGGKTKLTRTNLIFATIAGIVPEIYARNPEVAVKPSKGCAKERLPIIKKFARTAEQFLNETVIDEAKLKKRAKANIRSALGTSYGVLKLGLQEEYRGDPVSVRRVQDTQDNLSRVEALMLDLKKESDPSELALKRDELRANLDGLRSSNEVKMFKGFVLDRVRSEDFLVLDASITEFDEYVEASALGHKVYITVREYRTKFGHYPEKAEKYNTPYADEKSKAGIPQAASTLPEGMRDDDQYVCLIEIWDRSAGVIRTIAKGSQRWVKEPAAPRYTSERWYPFFVLGFDLIEGRWRPLSQVELLMGLQDEYDETRTAYAEDRKDAGPIRFFRKSGNMTEEDVNAIVRAAKSRRDLVGLSGNPTIPIDQDLGQLEGKQIKPENYDVSLIRNDIDMVAGRSDASRANLIKPKTATEAELMAQAMGSRSDERRDVSEDLMSDLFVAALEIGMRCFSKQEVVQMCGEDCVWPEGETTVEEIFSMVDVGVRAGSSGKPNSAQDKEQWLQLLPIIRDAITAVGEARATGNLDMANAAIELLRETIRRFEERIDVDSLIPPVEEGGEGRQLAEAQQQLQQLQQQMQQMQEEMAKQAEALQKAQAKEQEAVVKAQSDAEAAAREDQLKAAQAADEDAKAAREHEKDLAEIERQRQLDKDKLDNERSIASERIQAERDAKIEIAKINAGATEDEKAAKEGEAVEREGAAAHRQSLEQAMLQLNGLMERLLGLISGLSEDMSDFMDAPREVKYGEDGMPSGVEIKRNKRAERPEGTLQ